MTGNRLWAAFPLDVRDRLAQRARLVQLDEGRTVFREHERPEHIYFPESVLISRIARLDEGQTLEFGLIGRDGMAGISVLPGTFMSYDGVVQIPGTALRVEASAMRQELAEPGPMHELLGRYAWTLLSHSIRSAACNNFHTVAKRCARWLLTMGDVIERDDFPITQDLLALMLGVRRPSVTNVAHALHQGGIVEYRHGHLTICDRSRLEAEACSCYGVMRAERQQVIHAV